MNNTTTPRTDTVTITAQDLATIQTALLNETEHAHDAAKDADDPEMADRLQAASDRYETLWQRLSRIAHS